MKKHLSSTVMVLVIISTTAFSAQAEYSKNGPYIRADVGITMPRDNTTTAYTATTSISGKVNFDESPFLGAGFGYRWNDYLRTDLTLSYRDIDTSIRGGTNWDSSARNYTTMGAAYFDLAPALKLNTGKFEPYVLAGLGWAHNEQKSATATGELVGIANGKTNDDLAWKIGAGSGYKLNDSLTLDLAYQYVDLGKFEYSNQNSVTSGGTAIGSFTKAPEVDFRSHEVTLGLRYAF